jgi:hypothetical protein
VQESRRPRADGADRWLYAALLAGAVVRLVGLGTAPLWLDEVVTARWIALPWGEMLRAVLADNHPPLYFAVLKAWAGLAGTTAWALRVPSALASWATIPLIAGVASVLGGRRAARWAAWLAACSPFLVHHGQEARMYAFVGALSAAQLRLLARFLTGRTRALGAAFALSAAALVATHYYGAFLVVTEMLLLLVARRRPWTAWLPAWIACGLAVTGAFGAAALLATHTTGGTYQPGLAALPGIVWTMVSGYGLLPDPAVLHHDGARAMLPYLPLAVPGLAALLVAVALGLRASSPTARLLLGPTLAVTLLGPYAVGWILPGVGTNPRYAMAGVPALFALLAAGAPARVERGVPLLATGIVALALVIGAAVHVARPLDGREDVYAAGRWLDTHVPADAPILVTARDMATVATYHWPMRRIVVYPEPSVVVLPGNVDTVADRLPVPQGDRVFFLVGRAWDSDPDGVLPRALGARYRPCPGTAVAGIRIFCFDRDPATARLD